MPQSQSQATSLKMLTGEAELLEDASAALTVGASDLTSKKGGKVPQYPAIIPNWVRFDRLHTLSIAYCANFTDRGVESISATCKVSQASTFQVAPE